MAQYRYQEVSQAPSGEVEEQWGPDEASTFSNTSNTLRRLRSNSAIHILLLSFNLIFLTWNICQSRDHGSLDYLSRHTPQQPFSPARSSVQYSVQQFDEYTMHSSPFIGEPGPELDQAWSDLLKPTNIRISEDEMRKMGKTSIALKDGSGYIGYLEVHHMLHCLKRFKQYRHLDHYPGIDLLQYDLPHWDHCIEVLRHGIMCNADLMISTLEWNENGTWLDGVSRWPRQCADWDSVQNFAASRSIQVDRSRPFQNIWPKDDERSIGPKLAG